MSRISKIIESRRQDPGVFFKEPKLFVPVDMQVPETANQVLARTLLKSGVIDETTANKMLGVFVSYDVDSEKEFDNDEEEDFEEINDEFILSSFSEYEEDINGKEDQEQTAESDSESGTDSANVKPSEPDGAQGVSETSDTE